MSTIFERAFAIVIGNEGGLVNNPSDPGGLTNWGISQRIYPNVNIRNLTISGAQAIYQEDYWNKNQCDKLPPGLALLVFDCSVNGGHPSIWLQAAVGAAQDGQVGQRTLDAAAAAFAKADRGAAAIAEFQAHRIAYLASLPTWQTFGASSGQPKGWVRRCCTLIPQALSIGEQ